MVEAVQVHVGEELAAVLASKVHIAPDRRVASLSLAAGVRVVDEAPFKDRLDHIAQGMVHHSVAVRRRADQAPFGVEHEEVLIGPVQVSAVQKAFLDGEQFFFQVEIEKRCAFLEPLAELRLARRAQEVFEGSNPIKQVSVGFHGC